MINILVCDDDKLITQQIKQLLDRFQKKYHIHFNVDIEFCGDVLINKDTIYDIAIIDIEMPGISGLELSKLIKQQNSEVIIIILTSFSAYLDNAMDMEVFRYLSKPIELARFQKSLLSAVKKYKQISKRIHIKTDDGIYIIQTKDILYIENLKYGSIIFTKQGQFKTNKRLQEWFDIVNQPNCFVYSHKSFIVNLQNVIFFNREKITFQTNDSILEVFCVSQRKYSELKKSFFDYAGSLQ